MAPITSRDGRRRTNVSSRLNLPTISSTSSDDAPETSHGTRLSLARRTVMEFLQVAEDCSLVVNADDYALIAALADGDRNALKLLRVELRAVCVKAYRQNGRILIGKALVVPDNEVAQILATLPFRRNVMDMLSDVEGRFIGVPETLVKAWHVSALPYYDADKENAPPADLQSESKESTGTSASDNSSSDSLPPLSDNDDKTLDAAGTHSPHSSSKLVPNNLPSLLPIGDVTTPDPSLPTPDDDVDEVPFALSEQAPLTPSSFLVNNVDVPAILSSSEDIIEYSSVSPVVSEDAFASATVELDSPNLSRLPFSQPPSVTPRTRLHSRMYERGLKRFLEQQADLKALDEQIERTVQDDVLDDFDALFSSPRDDTESSSLSSIYTLVPPTLSSVSRLPCPESPTTAAGARATQRAIRKSQENTASHSSSSSGSEEGSGTTGSVQGADCGRKRAREEDAQDLEDEDDEDGPQRKRGRWERMWDKVSKPFHFLSRR